MTVNETPVVASSEINEDANVKLIGRLVPGRDRIVPVFFRAP
jgi:hypothetical protein